MLMHILGDTRVDNGTVMVYTLEFCPNCDTLKQFLKEQDVPYREHDLSTAESLTELRINGVFVNEAPVLRRGSRFLTSQDLFEAGNLQEDRVRALLEGN